jgi:IS30 family transposase
MASIPKTISDALELLHLVRVEDLSVQSTQAVIDESHAVKVNPLVEAKYWDAHHKIRAHIENQTVYKVVFGDCTKVNTQNDLSSGRSKQINEVNNLPSNPSKLKVAPEPGITYRSFNGVLMLPHETLTSPDNSNNSRILKGG